jgi:NADPH-dependent curcumin reductase CurA
MAMNSRQWRMRHRTEVLTPGDYMITETELPAPQSGQVLARVLMMALDPYLARSMQSWIGETPAWADGTIHGRVLAEVVYSEAEGLRVGDLVAGVGRWQDFEVFEARRLERIDADVTPPSLALGVLSGSGLTAWVGVHLVDPQAGQTMFISAATGTVGSVAGQLARQRGCRVVGLAGGYDKCRHAVDVLGFDACVDHTSSELNDQVADAAPDGIDVVFENVGAPSIDAALPAMVMRSRILLCGLAAHYNSAEPATLRNIIMLLFKQISIAPLAINDHRDLLGQARRELRDGLVTGSITYDESIVDGFEHAPTAYLDMLAGSGLGKRLLRIAD